MEMIIELVTETTSRNCKKFKSSRGKPDIPTNEKLSSTENKHASSIPNMFGNRDRHLKFRAHHFPVNHACNVFWGMVAEMISGQEFGEFDEEKKTWVRRHMAWILSKWKRNIFTFSRIHNTYYYDLLDFGQSLVILPILSIEEIAKWKQGDSYEVLVIASSKEVMDSDSLGYFESDTPSHFKWEDKGDLEKATEVLSAYTKAIADSLNQYFDTYYDKVSDPHFSTQFFHEKSNMSEMYDLLKSNGGKVEIPVKRPVKKECIQLGGIWWGRRKLLKINMGELYSRPEDKGYIPDPSMFAIKAAVNWSGRKPARQFIRLLPGHGTVFDESEEDGSYLSGVPSQSWFLRHSPSLENMNLEEVMAKIEEIMDKELLGREVDLAVSDGEDDDDNLSEVSSQRSVDGELRLDDVAVIVSDSSTSS